MFGDKRDEVAGGWTELLKAELCNLSKHTGACFINFVICILRKTAEIKWAGHVPCSEKMGSGY